MLIFKEMAFGMMCRLFSIRMHPWNCVSPLIPGCGAEATAQVKKTSFVERRPALADDTTQICRVKPVHTIGSVRSYRDNDTCYGDILSDTIDTA